ncbi:YDG domain-containing protein (plasmid) [Pseudomonas silesiensis]|uniref:YDG domain-containing protein n=1 Tax=Pseudomonas silesiensis TaxID=1853130 RepID=UPI0030D10CEC
MNKIHNVIWSKAQNAWVVVAEGSKSCSKAGSGALKVMIALILLSPAAGMASSLPQGGSISVGQGTITTNGSNQMVIKQNTDKLGINWQSFNVGADGHVVFDQPGTHSVALNRVIANDASSILGKIDANGQVFLINPNGVIFGKDSKVNVGGLVASTLNMTDADFSNGNYKFSAGTANGEIKNLGSLQAAEGGYIALIGKSVKNNGIIQAKLGSATLASGDAVTLDFSGDGLLSIQVDKSTVNALVENKGMIKADGGNVLMTARSSNALTQAVVNNEGVIEAQTIGTRKGKIFLDSGFEDGAVRVAGTLDASAPTSGDGGFIETSGKTVVVADGAKITTKAANGKTGDWLLDPTDFTISDGSGPQTSSGIGVGTLVASLASTNVELQTIASGAEQGNINVNSDVTWSADTKLTLTAHGGINVNSNINANGANSGVELKYGTVVNIADGKKINLTGANASYAENGVNFVVLRTAEDLKKLNDPAFTWSRFALANDIDASETSTWNGGLGYAPAAMSGTFFGTLNGLNHDITNLYINRPTEDNVGLIGYNQSSRLENIGVHGSVTGKNNVGLLSGNIYQGNVLNVRTSGTVTGESNVGGVAGQTSQATINRIQSAANVQGTSRVGGVLGHVSENTVKYVFSTGNVSGTDMVGGLIGDMIQTNLDYGYSLGDILGVSKVGGAVGFFDNGSINTIYSSGEVNGTGGQVGGLIGGTQQGAISKSFSTSKVSGATDAGGLIGNADRTTLSNVYATGAVSGTNNVGGLIGYSSQVNLNYSYATGLVTGSGNLGGLLGASNLLSISESFWDTTKSGLLSSAGGVGHADLTDASIYGNWDIALDGGSSKTWRIYDGQTGPLLRAFMGTGSASSANVNATYTGHNLTSGDISLDASSFTTDTSTSFFQPKTGQVLTSVTDNGAAIRNAGTYVLDNFYSTQFGYDLAQPVKASLVVAKAHLDINAAASDKTYDGNTNATVGFSDNRLGTDSLTISGTGAFADKNAGNSKTVSVTGVTVGGADASNYTWDSSLSTTADIDARQISVGVTGNDKTYDASTSAAVDLTAGSVSTDLLNSGIVSGDDLQVTGTATFSDKNAGAGKTVTVNGISLGGVDAGNYEIHDAGTPVQTTATINKATLTVTAGGVDKTYDGSTAAGATLADNRLGTDDLTITSSSSSFSDKNAGTGKVVNVGGINVTGTDALNYDWNTSAATTADINKAMLNVTAVGQDKTYDGNTLAGVTLSDDRIGGDVITVTSGASAFADKNAGTGKTVTVGGISVSGVDALNYDWNSLATTTADIDKAVLNVTATGQDKTYNGTTAADVTFADNRIGSDDLSVAGTASFGDKHASTGKTVNVGGISVTGADAQNYTWNSVTTTTASIFKALLNISATAQNKSYDGTDVAQVALSDDRVAGDDLTADAGASAFSDKNAGTSKSVTVNGITLAGADAANYTFNSTATTTADVSKASLTVKAESTGKIEGAADSTLSWSLQNGSLYGSDTVNGTLVRDAGESDGVYVINKGTLSAGSNYDLTVVPGTFEITKAPTVPPVVVPPVVVDPIPPVVVTPVVVPPVVVDPKPTVTPEEVKALETTKQIISTITVATKQATTSAAAAEPAKTYQTDTSAIIGDYRLLNLGMKLPDESFTEDSSKK